jgi:hypothetical protein
MRFGLRHWRARHLIGAWGAYWASLAAVTLGSPALALWRATRGPNGTSSVSASLGDAGVHLEVLRQGVTTWAGSASLGSVIFWTCGPPLLLWLAWLVRRPRRGKGGLASASDPAVLAAQAAPQRGLPAAPADHAMASPRQSEPVRVRRDATR